MPCADNGFSEYCDDMRARGLDPFAYVGKTLPPDDGKVKFIKEPEKWVPINKKENDDSVLCALTHELERMGILKEVMERASIASGLNVSLAKSEHDTEDEKRIIWLLESVFSQDEMETIKNILNR